VQQITARGKSEGDKFSAYVLGIVNSTAFRQRAKTALPE
jgi:hypothetical protein